MNKRNLYLSLCDLKKGNLARGMLQPFPQRIIPQAF